MDSAFILDLKCLWLDSVEHFFNEKWSKFNGHQFGLVIFAKQPPADLLTIGNTMTSLPEHKTISRLCYVWDMLCCFWHSNESWLNIRAEPIGDLSSSFVASAARQEDFGHGHFGYGSGQSRDRDMIWQNSAFHNTFLMAVWWATPMEFWAFFPPEDTCLTHVLTPVQHFPLTTIKEGNTVNALLRCW